MMKKTVLVQCSGCCNEFAKAKSAIKYALKKGSNKNFCSRKCQAKHANNNKKGNPKNLKPGKSRDEFSSFRYFLWKSRSRHAKKKLPETDLTLEYLKELWIKQEGKCPITGWDLFLPESMTEWSGKRKITKDTASLDRIDSSKPYMQHNVRFVAYIANVARNCFSDKELKDFCISVANNLGF